MLATGGMSLLHNHCSGQSRHDKVAKGLRRLCEMAGVRYRSPHTLRHSNAVFGLQRSQDMATYKAVSQNLMHKSLAITDEVYAILDQTDVQEKIDGLTRSEFGG